MLNEEYKFSDNQDLSGLTSTGEVSTETWDLEEIHSGSVVDDQVKGWIIVTIMADTSFTGGTEGLMIEVRTAAAEALASGYEVVGARSVLPAKVVVGGQVAIPIYCDIAQKELGLWYKAINTTFTGTIYVDADFAIEKVVKNESIQRVRSSIG